MSEKTISVKEFSKALDLKVLAKGDMERPVKSGCCCDLLSWAMSKAQEGDVWFTVIGNINAVGVASLTDVSCIVLTEDAVLNDDALKRAEAEDIPIFQTEKSSYEMAVLTAGLLCE